MPDDAFRENYAAFIRKARQASHQALYFLRTLESACDVATDEVVREYADFALVQLRALVSVISPPTGPGIAEVDPRQVVDWWVGSICTPLFGDAAASVPPMDGARLCQKGEAKTLRVAFEGLLERSTPHPGTAAWCSHIFVRSTKWVHKNLLMCFGLVTLGVAYCQVDAVKTLFSLDEWAALAGVLLASFLAVPVWRGLPEINQALRLLAAAAPAAVVMALAPFLLGGNGGALVTACVSIVLAYLYVCSRPQWNIAHDAFRSLHYMALQPERGLRRWPAEPPNTRRTKFEVLGLIAAALLFGVLLWCISELYPELGPKWMSRVLSVLLVLAFALILWFSKRKTQLLWLMFRGMLWRLLPLGLAVVCLCVLVMTLKEPGTTLTVFSILVLGGAFLLLCRAFDFWDFIDPWPIRLIGLAQGLLFAGLTYFSQWGQQTAAALFLITAGLTWCYTKDRSTKWMVTLIFIAAAEMTFVGALTRQREIWTDIGQPRWERVCRWPYPSPGGTSSPVVIIAASGGGSRAALYTAMTLDALQAPDLHPLRDNLQLISSVSGGSLANAAYVARRYWKVTNTTSAASQQPDSISLADLVGDDYLFPTLKGALIPGESRGLSIEDWWKDHTRLENLRLSEVAKVWNAHTDTLPPYPLPVFNSCSLDGHDVIISPLDTSLYLPLPHRQEPCPENSGEETWVYDRDGMYDLVGLTTFNPTLANAVRASANFPFGFPLVTVKVSEPASLRFTPCGHEKEDEIQLTDGGVLSNSGMWPVYRLLMRQVEALKGRGVLLIVVEASKMPEYRSFGQKLSSLYGTIQDSSPHGQSLHWQMFERLDAAYAGRLRVVQIDLIPDEEHNVLTTWALSGRQEKILRCSFDTRWAQVRPRICAAWNTLVNHEPGLQVQGEPMPETVDNLVAGTDRPPLN